MRQLTSGLLIAVLTLGCSTNAVPVAPTPSALSAPGIAANVDAGNWTPWYFAGWQPGLGSTLVPSATVEAIVEVDDECVPDLRLRWDARASCHRFSVSVDSNGWLDVFLRWDASAPGFDPTLSGDVVLVAPNGQFTASDWQHTEEHAYARVRPGSYGVLVMSYVPASLPFQIRAELRPE